MEKHNFKLHTFNHVYGKKANSIFTSLNQAIATINYFKTLVLQFFIHVLSQFLNLLRRGNEYSD